MDIKPYKITVETYNEDIHKDTLDILRNHFDGVEIIDATDSDIKNKSKSNKITSPKKHTLEDVIGLKEAKESLKDFTIYNQIKEIETVLGYDMPKGYLLEGNPGVGKTYLYQAVINEAELNGIKVHSTNISASTHGSMWVNKTSNNIMDEHKKAVKRLKKGETELEMIFLDETDSIAGDRNEAVHNPGYVKVVNTFNEIIDGVHAYEGIYFIGCTNRITAIDSAFIRAGRIIPIKCLPPDKEELNELFKHYKNKIQSNAQIELFGKLNYSELTELGWKKKFTGADVNEIFREAKRKIRREMVEKNLKKPLTKINQKNLKNLINNYDMIRKGEKFKTNPIGIR